MVPPIIKADLPSLLVLAHGGLANGEAALQPAAFAALQTYPGVGKCPFDFSHSLSSSIDRKKKEKKRKTFPPFFWVFVPSGFFFILLLTFHSEFEFYLFFLLSLTRPRRRNNKKITTLGFLGRKKNVFFSSQRFHPTGSPIFQFNYCSNVAWWPYLPSLFSNPIIFWKGRKEKKKKKEKKPKFSFQSDSFVSFTSSWGK